MLERKITPEEESLKNKLKIIYDLDKAEAAVTLITLYGYACDVLCSSDNKKFYRFFAEMVERLGNPVRIYVKELYLALSAKVPYDIMKEMDTAETVRKYSNSMSLGTYALHRMLYLDYHCADVLKTGIDITITEEEYFSNRDKYDTINPEVVKQYIVYENLDKAIESEWGEELDVLTVYLCEELKKDGILHPDIREYTDEEIESILLASVSKGRTSSYYYYKYQGGKLEYLNDLLERTELWKDE